MFPQLDDPLKVGAEFGRKFEEISVGRRPTPCSGRPIQTRRGWRTDIPEISGEASASGSAGPKPSLTLRVENLPPVCPSEPYVYLRTDLISATFLNLQSRHCIMFSDFGPIADQFKDLMPSYIGS